MKNHHRFIYTLLSIFILVTGFTVEASAQETTQDTPANTFAKGRKKVGVVLSGGGAKGIVHIGALKVLEEAGIPIDYIAGTSMGAIMGGLYSIGYSPYMLDSLVRAQNWPDLLADRVPRREQGYIEREINDRYILTLPLSDDKKIEMPTGLLGGNNVYNLLSELSIEYNDSLSFLTLPIPFTCVAYDLASGKSVNLEAGSLPTAMRASMSIPGAFPPVAIDSMFLIDGGITNNFPADVVRDMGADVIIGIDVAAGLKTVEEIKHLPDVLGQITWFAGLESYESNRKLCDIYIHPDIEGYNPASFQAASVDSLLVRGERATREKWEDLMALKRAIGLYSDYRPVIRPEIDYDKEITIAEVRFEGLKRYSEKTVMYTAGIKPNSCIPPSEIQNAASKLQGMPGISGVQFRVEGSDPYILIFTIKESSRNFLNLGVRFDTEEMAAILLNMSIAPNNMPKGRFELTGKLSENPYGKVTFIAGNEADRRMSFSYRFKYNKLSVYDHGKKYSNLDFSQHTVDFHYSNVKIRQFRATLGARFDYYHYDTLLASEEFRLSEKYDRLISYYGILRYESLDSRYIPRKGFLFNAEYTLYTTDFYSNDGGKPFSAVDVDILGAISVSKRVTFLPGFFGRVIIGENVPFPALNMMGGKVDGRYMPQQIAFTGMNHFELFDHTLIGVKLDLRIKLWRKNYLSVRSNYAIENGDLWNVFKDGHDFWGAGLSWSYDTIMGPISLQVDYSSRSKNVGVYGNIGYYF